MSRPVRIFVSYSHLDKRWFRKLVPLLKFDIPAQMLHVWHDHELVAGDLWDDEIRAELNQMDVFLCLVSYHFYASDYIKHIELDAALRRAQTHETLIVPLFLCEMADRDIEALKLKPYNPLPEWGRHWLGYRPSMTAHKPIRTGLYDVIDRAQRKFLASE